MTPSPPADRRTILRRVYFDLIGLRLRPRKWTRSRRTRLRTPTQRVVDRLLASPHHGERWGRHWLDVARYANTKDGVLMFGDDRVRPFAYTYRDYVIRAFNEDLPFDQFVQDQLAADVAAPRMSPGGWPRWDSLTLGKGFDNNIHDQIDNRIDVVTRGFLGLTVSCCPMPRPQVRRHSDGRLLFALRNLRQLRSPAGVADSRSPGGARQAERLREAGRGQRREIRQFLETQYKLLSETARRRTPDYLIRAATIHPTRSRRRSSTCPWPPRTCVRRSSRRWRRFVKDRSRPDDPVFGPWHDLMALGDTDFAAKACLVIERCGPARAVGPPQPDRRRDAREGRDPVPRRCRRVYGELICRVDEEARKTAPTISAVAEDRHACRSGSILADREGPAYFPESQTYYYMSRARRTPMAGSSSSWTG